MLLRGHCIKTTEGQQITRHLDTYSKFDIKFKRKTLKRYNMQLSLIRDIC